MRSLDVPGLGAYNGNVPIILVVSSMAGGAGARWRLDVCRLLTLISGLDPKLMGVFLVAPNIFDALPAAGRDRRAARTRSRCCGEIVASQTGSAVDADTEALQALGLNPGAGVETSRSRGCSRSAGSPVSSAPSFGDGSPDTVYRGPRAWARGADHERVRQLTSSFLTTSATLPPPTATATCSGWGSIWEPLPWGSYGFASLSMGRDRYAEYSAQRLARTCVTRLLEGHLQRGNRASGTEQVKALLEANGPGSANGSGLPLDRVRRRAAGSPARLLTGTRRTRRRVRVVERLPSALRPPGREGMQATHWMAQALASCRARRPRSGRRAGRRPRRWPIAGTASSSTRIENDVREAISRLGLPTPLAVVDRLTRYCRDLLAPQAELLAAHARADVTAVPSVAAAAAGPAQGR